VSCGEGEDDCKEAMRLTRGGSGERYWKSVIKDEFGIIMSDKGDKAWDIRNLEIVYSSLRNINAALSGNLPSLVRGAKFKLRKQDPADGDYHGVTHLDGSGIDFYTLGDDAIRQMNVYHEVGHLLDNLPGMKDVFTNAVKNEGSPSWVQGGFINKDALISLNITNDPNYASVQAIQAYNTGLSEEWADAFANYVVGNINTVVSPGMDMYNFVTAVLSPYTGIP
jgi:hypothetical protein